ncbi:MAG: radical SAM protein, partial [Bacteroidota bacterium]
MFDEAALRAWLYRERAARDEEALAERIQRLAVKAVRSEWHHNDDDVMLEARVWDRLEGEALGAGVARALRSRFALLTTREVSALQSRATTKFVLALGDGELVETVVMRHAARTTVCVSSQVGCAMGCSFCATGTVGIARDLQAWEIVEQVLRAQIHERTAAVNVVFMGQGEPLANYGNVSKALTFLTRVLALRRRSVTVSTVGVVPALKKLTRDFPEVSLALSLHAPTQALRQRIVPSAKRWPLPQLMEAL